MSKRKKRLAFSTQEKQNNSVRSILTKQPEENSPMVSKGGILKSEAQRTDWLNGKRTEVLIILLE